MAGFKVKKNLPGQGFCRAAALRATASWRCRASFIQRSAMAEDFSRSFPQKSQRASASDSEEAPKKERKKRGPMTEEQKAAAKAKRDAKKGGGGGTSASESDSDAPPPPVVAPHPPAAAPALVFNKKTAAKPSPFSLEQLSNFEPKDIEGAEHGVNCRGDVVDSDGNYIGKWNSKTKVLQRGGVVPADWAAILNAMTIPAPKD